MMYFGQQTERQYPIWTLPVGRGSGGHKTHRSEVPLLNLLYVEVIQLALVLREHSR
jgi:hypothetical protein